MDKAQLQKIFSKAYDHNEWLEVLKQVFGARQLLLQPKPISLVTNDITEAAFELGNITTSDDRIIGLYKIDVKSNVWLERNKVGLRKLLRDVYKYDVDGALIVFVQEKKWRFSFVSEIRTEEGKQETEPKRYTYLFGEGESSRTASERFEVLIKKPIKIQDLFEAFNVEKLNKSFFNEYQKHYEKFVLFLTGEIWKKKQNKYELTEIQEPSLLLNSAFYGNKKSARDFCKKLLGRIVFLHFLQKKGWMGCPVDDKDWENGRQQFMLELFNGFEKKDSFHSKCLTELFFNTLNKPGRQDIFKVEGLINELNGSKVPYLNGGLFETDSNCDPFKVDFPESYFKELLDFFGQYNFTIDENSPIDHEVGIDPEMLGHIFENLLEENKEKGAFYTPKEIVQYMTQESLIQYLKTHLGEHIELELFIKNNDIGDRSAKHNFIRDNAAKIEELLDNLKICDPAIGSGAFPMGILNEIFEAKMLLDMTLDRSEVKKKIIQNSIYGVDLDSGAVDIARLRFWLALVVDEDVPHALPNLDYKIMQGNSLLESFEGLNLSQIYKGKALKIDDSVKDDNLFSKVMDVQEVYNEEKFEDLIKEYFDLNDPIKKKKQHDKIDKQVLGKIYKCLNDEFEEIESEITKLSKKIKSNSANLTNADQKIKYEITSKDAKNLKKLQDQINSITHKQQKLKGLYESNERPFFLWHLMFQDVFKNEGFDIIIGNPPYGVSIKGDYRTNVVKELGKVPDFEIYYYFIELAYKFAKPEAILSYIIPNTYLFNTFAENYRDEILEKWNLIEVLDCTKFDIFENATVRNTINTWSKGISNKIGYRQTKNIKSFNQLLSVERQTISRQQIKLLNQNWGLAFFLDNQTIEIVSKIKKDKFNAIDLFPEMSQGLIAYDKYKGQDDEVIKNRIYHYMEKSKPGLKKWLWGADVTRYNVNWNEKEYIDYCNGIANPRDPSFFNGKRLLIREITNPTVFAAITSEELYNDPAIIIVKESDNSLEGFEAILNSKLGSFYHFNNSPKATKGAFPKILVQDIKNFPLPDKERLYRLGEFVKIRKLLIEFEAKLNLKTIYIELFDEIIDALVLEAYFAEDFRSKKIQIMEYAFVEFCVLLNSIQEINHSVLEDCFSKIQEKKNPLRNQIKLMKLELKQLLNPILSV